MRILCIITRSCTNLAASFPFHYPKAFLTIDTFPLNNIINNQTMHKLMMVRAKELFLKTYPELKPWQIKKHKYNLILEVNKYIASSRRIKRTQ